MFPHFFSYPRDTILNIKTYFVSQVWKYLDIWIFSFATSSSNLGSISFLFCNNNILSFVLNIISIVDIQLFSIPINVIIVIQLYFIMLHIYIYILNRDYNIIIFFFVIQGSDDINEKFVAQKNTMHTYLILFLIFLFFFYFFSSYMYIHIYFFSFSSIFFDFYFAPLHAHTYNIIRKLHKESINRKWKSCSAFIRCCWVETIQSLPVVKIM